MSGNMAAVAGEAIGANYMPQRGFLPSEGSAGSNMPAATADTGALPRA